jgi:capsular polysaccharide transport system ATP-binding protein
MIEIKNLYKRYHNHHGSDWVLKDINLTIPDGISVGLIGANGAGKSTLLRLIAGMDSPERGEVIRTSRVSWPVGVTGGMQNNMTGRQNAKFVARVQGYKPKDVEQVIKFVEEFAEIGEAFDEPVRTYSSGMRSRVAFGLSLAFDFDVYISDEATAVGDRAFKEKAKALFRSKVGQSSLIMVSHSEGIIKDLCQAGVYIKEGEAFWYDDVNAAIKTYHADSDAKRATSKGKPAKAPAAAKVAPAKAPANKADPLPDDIPSARQYLKQCRQKLKKAKEGLATAEEQQFLPYVLQFMKNDIDQRHTATLKARKHLEALEKAQQNPPNDFSNQVKRKGSDV